MIRPESISLQMLAFIEYRTDELPIKFHWTQYRDVNGNNPIEESNSPPSISSKESAPIFASKYQSNQCLNPKAGL